MESPESMPSASSAARRAIVISCEHAGFEIPTEYRQRVIIPPTILSSHRGYDAGGREIALALGEQMGVVPILSTHSRLLVDLNRSESFAGVFSSYGKTLSEQERQEILQRHYRPFRAIVREAIEAQVANGSKVLHISVHTFTPVLRGERRTADIGLLFDPDRPEESRVAAAWRDSLLAIAPRLVVKMNYPYLGTDDGHTTSLRTFYPDAHYAGIELEVNQKWYRGSTPRFAKLLTALRQSLANIQ
jgi:predicted N-formylglutamate amidohydrolase